MDAPALPLAPEHGAPRGRTRVVLDLVSAAADLTGCSVASTITASLPEPPLGGGLMPHLSRVSRVEVRHSGRCRVLRVVELERGSVVVTNGLEHTQALASVGVEEEDDARVTRLATRLFSELADTDRTDATNEDVVELTTLLLDLDPGVLTELVRLPLLTGAPFLSATARPEFVREGPVEPRLLALVRDLASGAPLEWSLRRHASGDR